MPGTPLLTLAGSLAAFALGFHLFREDEPSPTEPQSLIVSQSPTATTPSAAASSVEVSPDKSIPPDLLSEVEFARFDSALGLTPEACLLLGIREEEAKAVTEAAHEFRDAIELAQSRTARARRKDPMSQEDRLFVEVDPLGAQFQRFADRFQARVQEVLGLERAAFIDVPSEIGPDHSLLYRPSTGMPGVFHEVRVIWSDANDGSALSYHSQTVNMVPSYVTEFFAIHEENE